MPNLKQPLEPTTTDFIIFGSKVCPACGRKLPKCGDWFASDDHQRSSDGLSTHCKECRNIRTRTRYQDDDEYRKERLAQVGERNRQRYATDEAYREMKKAASRKSAGKRKR